MSVDFRLIGERIKIKRLEKKLTQEQLAEKLDVTVGYISQCERGISKINLEKLSEVAYLLSCDIGYFVTGSSVECGEYLKEAYVEKYEKLTPTQKKQIIGFIDVMLNNF